MNPDQTAPKEQSDLSPYRLQYRLPKYISRWESRRHMKNVTEKNGYVNFLSASVWILTLKRQEKNASENVVCWSCLLQIIA